MMRRIRKFFVPSRNNGHGNHHMSTGGTDSTTCTGPNPSGQRTGSTTGIRNGKASKTGSGSGSNQPPASSSSSRSSAADAFSTPPTNSVDAFSLRIVNPRGGLVCVEVTRDCTGARLKTCALERFASCSFSLPHFSSDIEQLAGKYKLIRSRNRTVLLDGDTLDKLGVEAEEEFLLVVKRTDFIPAEEGIRGPSIAEVLAATKHIPLSRTSQPNSTSFNIGMLQTDLQQDLRRILISLARASAFVIGSGPCAEKLVLLFNQRLTIRRRHQARSIETLLEMGFSLDKIHQALELTRNNFPATLDWLIQNDSSAKLLNCDTLSCLQSTPSIATNATQDDPTQAPSSSHGGTTSGGRTVPNSPVKADPTGDEHQENFTSSSSPVATTSSPPEVTTDAHHQGEVVILDEDSQFVDRMQSVETLLDIIRQYADRDVYPVQELVNSIMEMGFDERSVRDALMATRNNQAAACEWLLGNRSKSLTELRDGLSPDSPILQVLLASPQVQISLGNPKMFIALLSMLDNSSTMTMWLSDNDTSSVLGHILRTYHEEKHIVAINQFNNSSAQSNANNSTN
ncbi:ubiquitin-associated domain-containing protein 1 isoform X2 [Uranotaenia lowii]|uniref:ubiquitin-associated domain-containing protein 1 isoform X2 n=1 Tax=Uranotaenia lowii TaxID=190385 RepID=UPI0024784F24|nr:ubiquitin-associated domain-containing protein 1 isoform X2 [Uranotaenia lowii]